MEKRFIKYKEGQVNLTKLYRVSHQSTLDDNDVQDGTLVIGTFGEGKYLAMGYLRGTSRDIATGKVVYEIVSAIEGDSSQTIHDPYRVNTVELPYFAATGPDSMRPFIGHVFKCNGELAVMDIGGGYATVNVNSIFELTPYFEDTNI